MFEFLKRLVKTKEAPHTYASGEVEALLADEMEETREAMRAGVLAHRDAILQAQQAIAALLPSFAPPRDLPDSHPKLRSITERSLPLFLKAMEAAVNRPIPEDPDGCYREAGEVLRSCLRTMQGQGRYLSSTHRREMEQVRAEVSRIGSAVNAMTDVVTPARRRMVEIDAVEAPLRELTSALGDAGKTAGGIQDMERQLRELEKQEEDFQKARNLLEAGEGFREVQDLTRRISVLETARDDMLRGYQAVAARAIHLFRKAEGAAQRAHDSTGADLFRAAREHLDMVPPPQGGLIRSLLLPAVARARDLSGSQVLVLKTPDDRALIAGEMALVDQITPLLERYHELTREIDGLHHTRAGIPALAEHRMVLERLRTVEKERAQRQENLGRLRTHREDLDGKIPPLREKLGEALSALLGSPCRIRD